MRSSVRHFLGQLTGVPQDSLKLETTSCVTFHPFSQAINHCPPSQQYLLLDMSADGTKNGTTFPLEFVVVGGGELRHVERRGLLQRFEVADCCSNLPGISGLSAAYCLCKAGHRVKVLEQAPRLGFPSSGLRVPPNMSKILRRWVGEAELRKTAVLNLETPCIDSKPLPFFDTMKKPSPNFHRAHTYCSDYRETTGRGVMEASGNGRDGR